MIWILVNVVFFVRTSSLTLLRKLYFRTLFKIRAITIGLVTPVLVWAIPNKKVA